ncbi:NUDIX domain-containing protein [Corynebacterium caspium]|uniref:NUDIX domain-containing protein n=1 Tax=Corynebacterium caspium TaxID=234828 RepID=UPI00036CA638|nr:NUDIX hydrolase [Corynebacterium caspium]WKD58664.1 hypothetical protein CCASP_01190 [Corynebacterium caspium DSM 44850]
MIGDGNGWALGPQETKVWGRYGAAGLFLITTAPIPDPDPDFQPRILLQHRAPWTAHGGTWALPGGARDSHETATQTALREAVEETNINLAELEVLKEVQTAGPGPAPDFWTYTTVLATCTRPLATTPNAESLELRWVPISELGKYPLLGAFRESLPLLLQTYAQTWHS